MSKTPEEMAEEYERFNWCVNGLKSAFLAGYEAAMKQYDIALIEEKIKRESKEVLMQMIKQRSEDWNNK